MAVLRNTRNANLFFLLSYTTEFWLPRGHQGAGPGSERRGQERRSVKASGESVRGRTLERVVSWAAFQFPQADSLTVGIENKLNELKVQVSKKVLHSSAIQNF